MPHPAPHKLLLALILVALGACSTSPQGRKQLTVPAPISDAYSDLDMKVQLATTANSACLGDECAANQEFDQRVLRIGSSLADAAFAAHPDLGKRISQFQFLVADKEKPGLASNASGTIVVFRGVQKLGLDDDALSFLIAREMGHVICQHHDENSSAKILVSVLAGVLFPALNLFQGSTVAAQAGTATSSVATSTTMVTTAATTATSYLGSQAVIATIKPNQLTEADTVAMSLLAGMGWNPEEAFRSLEACTQQTDNNAWLKDLGISVTYARKMEAKNEARHLASTSTLLDIEPEPAEAATDSPPSTAATSELQAETTAANPPMTAETEMPAPTAGSSATATSEPVALANAASSTDAPVQHADTPPTPNSEANPQQQAALPQESGEIHSQAPGDHALKHTSAAPSTRISTRLKSAKTRTKAAQSGKNKPIGTAKATASRKSPAVKKPKGGSASKPAKKPADQLGKKPAKAKAKQPGASKKSGKPKK